MSYLENWKTSHYQLQLELEALNKQIDNITTSLSQKQLDTLNFQIVAKQREINLHNEDLSQYIDSTSQQVAEMENILNGNTNQVTDKVLLGYSDEYLLELQNSQVEAINQALTAYENTSVLINSTEIDGRTYYSSPDQNFIGFNTENSAEYFNKLATNPKFLAEELGAFSAQLNDVLIRGILVKFIEESWPFAKQLLDHVSLDKLIENQLFGDYSEIPESWSELSLGTETLGDYLEGDISALIDNLRDKINQASQTKSPLVLDLNADGIIQTTNKVDGVHFDHDNNGFAELSAWVNPEDALLVRDINANGLIDKDHKQPSTFSIGHVSHSNNLLKNYR